MITLIITINLNIIILTMYFRFIHFNIFVAYSSKLNYLQNI